MKTGPFVAVLCLGAISLFPQPKDNPAKNETPATHSTPTPAPPNRGQKSANDTEATKSGPPHWYTSSEWWLVLIAALTGAAIAYQAREMAKTTEIIGRQADLMKTQTDILVEYNKATRDAADAAIKNANTASANIEFLISKERMRISVDVLPLKLPPPDRVLSHEVKYKVMYHGTTLATIVDTGFEISVTDSKESPTGHIFFGLGLPSTIPPQFAPEIRTALIYKALTQSDIDSIMAGKSFVHFRGFIKYRDVFEREHWTRFNQVWEYSDLKNFDGTPFGSWIDCGTPEDNSEI